MSGRVCSPGARADGAGFFKGRAGDSLRLSPLWYGAEGVAMQFLKSLLSGAVVAGFALGLSGCGGESEDTITIAIAGSITGKYAAFGEQLKRGAEMAVKDI